MNRGLLAAIAALSTLFFSFAACAAETDPYAQVARLGRGMNILSDDPIWENPAKARLQPRHFARIRAAGFQNVRVVLHGFAHMDRDNRLDPKWLSTLDWMIKTARANRLMIVLDEHDHHACGNDAVACRPRLMAFWRQVAAHYRAEPDDVLFEILNEPNGALTPALWNRYFAEALAIVRASNPSRTVIVGPADWNGFDALDALALPAADRNLIVTVHYYIPMRFTHQGASWVADTAGLSGIEWGSEADQTRLARDFNVIGHWAEAHRRPIFLGEFGAYDKADMASRLRYIAAVVRAAEARRWAWAYWQFDSDFIAYDMARDDWVPSILRALIPENRP